MGKKLEYIVEEDGAYKRATEGVAEKIELSSGQAYNLLIEILADILEAEDLEEDAKGSTIRSKLEGQE